MKSFRLRIWMSVAVGSFASLVGGTLCAQSPVVSLTATQAATSEPLPNARIRPGEFTIARLEAGSEPLIVFLIFSGSATPGADYIALPTEVTIPADGLSTTLKVIALSDSDDQEDEENVVARLRLPPPESESHYVLGTENSAEITIADGPAVPPVVTLEVGDIPAKTSEPCPACPVEPVSVTISRRGSVVTSLSVDLRIGGSATSGVDYRPLPREFVIPEGRMSATFSLTALHDALAEGPETVEIAIEPLADHYVVGDPGRVYIVIDDNDDNAPAERLDFVHPSVGGHFPSGVQAIDLRALAVSTLGEIDWPIQFFANDFLIGNSDPPQFDRPPIPCLPREHDFRWMNPADGEHILTARVQLSPGKELSAAPIRITVGDVPTRPVISIEATHRVAEEDSAPTARPFVMRGEYTISRTGPTATSQPVYLHVSGTASAGLDYEPLPFLVNIPRGASSTTVQVEAIRDEISEPLETVIAEISNCPPGDILPPCYDFAIDPTRSLDTVFIRDDGITRATLDIRSPTDGVHFTSGREIAIEAAAIDMDGAITAIDFYAGARKIGESQIFFFVQPPPGTPVMHQFIWSEVSDGEHVLTARAKTTGGSEIVSSPVAINVAEFDGLPVVTVSPTDPMAMEPIDGTPAKLATLALHRSGSTEEPLEVNYTLAGSATNGIDYQSLNGFAVFPPGDGSVSVVIIPMEDEESEGNESVLLTVEPQFDDGPERYRVGMRRRAIALIADSSPIPLDPNSPICIQMEDGFFHLCFPSPSRPVFRIERSDDLRIWMTVHEGASIGDTVHFVDPETPTARRRFYRIDY